MNVFLCITCDCTVLQNQRSADDVVCVVVHEEVASLRSTTGEDDDGVPELCSAVVDLKLASNIYAAYG